MSLPPMRKTLLISATLVSALMLGLASCKKKGPDLSKYDDVCAVVQKCDQNPQSKMLLMQPEACQKMFASLDKNPQTAAFTPQVIDCVKKADCAKLDTFKCFAQSAQGLMPMMPAQN